MFIREFSDLHLEFEQWTIPPLDTDPETVLVLAGDIGVGKREGTYPDFIAKATEQFRDVIYIPGNHEYYGGAWTVTWDKMEQRILEHMEDFGGNPDRLHMMNMGMVDIDGVHFIGATLWTDMCDGHPRVMHDAGRYMNDYRVIRRGYGDDPYMYTLRPTDTMAEHYAAKEYIDIMATDARAEGHQVVVVTHHAPTWDCVAPDYIGDELNGAYVSDLTELIARTEPTFWFHGHVHWTHETRVHNTKVMANAKGYPRGHDRENPDFDEFNLIKL